MDDKSLERDRYEARARLALESPPRHHTHDLGSAGINETLRAPYTYYEQRLRELVLPRYDVLELGSGSGMHTASLLRAGARVTATDISGSALKLLQRQLADIGDQRLVTRVADMEALPFRSGSFDLVACAGSLSYGDPDLVDAEVRRVLRPGGTFVCVDSLNHNPIYRLNRWVQYAHSRRSRSTLLRMPDSLRIEKIRRHFTMVEVRYFGALTWAAPVLAKLLGVNRAARALDAFDEVIGVRRSAFKFVLVAEGRR